MEIIKMPENIRLTKSIKKGYRAREGNFYGWGRTRLEAIKDVIERLTV